MNSDKKGNSLIYISVIAVLIIIIGLLSWNVIMLLNNEEKMDNYVEDSSLYKETAVPTQNIVNNTTQTDSNPLTASDLIIANNNVITNTNSSNVSNTMEITNQIAVNTVSESGSSTILPTNSSEITDIELNEISTFLNNSEKSKLLYETLFNSYKDLNINFILMNGDPEIQCVTGDALNWYLEKENSTELAGSGDLLYTPFTYFKEVYKNLFNITIDKQWFINMTDYTYIDDYGYDGILWQTSGWGYSSFEITKTNKEGNTYYLYITTDPEYPEYSRNSKLTLKKENGNYYFVSNIET